jgi:hypothetical protein
MIAGAAARETGMEWSLLRARLSPLAVDVGVSGGGSPAVKRSPEYARLSRMSPAAFRVGLFRDVQRGNHIALREMRKAADSDDRGVQYFVAFARPLVSRFNILLTNDSAVAPTTAGLQRDLA